MGDEAGFASGVRVDAQPAHGLSCHWPARCEKPRNDAGFGGFLGSGRKGGWWGGGTLRQTYVTQRLRTAANSCGKMRNSALVAGDPTSSHLRLASAASGYALRSFPRASTSTEKEINHHRLVLYLSTIGRAGRGLPSLVNIRSAGTIQETYRSYYGFIFKRKKQNKSLFSNDH